MRRAVNTVDVQVACTIAIIFGCIPEDPLGVLTCPMLMDQAYFIVAVVIV